MKKAKQVMKSMDKELRSILEGILDNEDNAGSSDGMTVTTKFHCDLLRDYMKEYVNEEARQDRLLRGY